MDLSITEGRQPDMMTELSAGMMHVMLAGSVQQQQQQYHDIAANALAGLKGLKTPREPE